MALTDVYCRVNRARGLELLSPEDLLNACRQFSALNLPISLRTFDSGVMVIQSSSYSDYEIAESVSQLVCIFFKFYLFLFKKFCRQYFYILI